MTNETQQVEISAGHTRPAPGYPGYSVSSDGRVFSNEHNWRGYGVRELIQDKNTDGYPSVRLTVNSKRTRVSVHWLVARAFLGEKPSATSQVCHINGDHADNRVENLRWGTAMDNAADREKHGRTSRGRKHSEAIIKGLAENRG